MIRPCPFSAVIDLSHVFPIVVKVDKRIEPAMEVVMQMLVEICEW
jgi:hypothetical protein